MLAAELLELAAFIRRQRIVRDSDVHEHGSTAKT
jgi:hypothetical protein